MIAMHNSLTDLLHFQQRMQNDTAHALYVIHQLQQDHANQSLTNDTSTFDGKLELYLDWILKLENIAAVTK